MKKYVIILLIMISLIFGYYTYNSNNVVHEHIDVSNVASITIYGDGIKDNVRNANVDEIQDIVNWYNSITDIRKNKDGSGTTPDSSISIQLKANGSPKKIAILKSGLDFEIQRYDKKQNLIAYWGKQSNIKQLLLEASKK